ncbi:MAG: tyrosine--tRNA ligase [Candidatus Verstraetearchaeota archaeon]|nr:tyrosine--tRNA ligase [Candidatus Verstraetearchaeota archaeon]
MDVTKRVNLVTRNTLEVITKEDAEAIFQRTSSPKGYIGVEPSGLFHLGWIIWVNKFKDLMEAGVKMTLLEATWHAWINDKFGGDMAKIQLCSSYLEHCLKALGVDLSRVTIIKADEMINKKAYWEGLLRIAKSLSLSRIKRAVTIMGRKEDDTLVDFSKLIYPCMQVEDIFYLDLDFCLGGMDQRRAHVLAREVAGVYGYKKPVAVHTPLLSSLQGAGRMDVQGEMDATMIDYKMSKSRPETCIFIHEPAEQIKSKLSSAYCPPKEVQGNPILDLAHYVLMYEKGFTIKRSPKYGGDVAFTSPSELLSAYQQGSIHPLDLKNAVFDGISSLLAPVRKYFQKVPEANNLLESLETSTKKQ